MRTHLFGLIALCSGGASAQASLFDEVKPDVIVIVREHVKTGADLVEISLVKADFPASTLRRQIDALGKELGSNPRGVVVGTQSLQTTRKLEYLRATFAVDGLIEHDLSTLRIQPLLRALAGVKEPNTIHGINILFDGEKPTKLTVEKYHLDKVLRSEARFLPFPRGIEYRVELLSQNPSEISFPDKLDQPNEKAPQTTSVPRDNRVILFVLFGIAGIALGALVYFAMLRGAPRKPTQKR